MGFFGKLWNGVKKAASGVGNFVGEITGYNAAQRSAKAGEQQAAAATQQAEQREEAWQQYQNLSANAANIFSNMYAEQGAKAAEYTDDIGKSKDIYNQLGQYATGATAAGARGESAATAAAAQTGQYANAAMAATKAATDSSVNATRQAAAEGKAGLAEASGLYKNATSAANAGLATSAGGLQALQNLNTNQASDAAAAYEAKYGAGKEAQEITEAARRNQQSALRNAGLNKVQAAMGASQSLTDTYNTAQAAAKGRQLQAAQVGAGLGSTAMGAQSDAAKAIAQTGLSTAELQQSGALSAAGGVGAIAGQAGQLGLTAANQEGQLGLTGAGQQGQLGMTAANQAGQLGLAGANAAMAGQNAAASTTQAQAAGLQSASAQQASLASQAAATAGQGLSSQAATAAQAGQNTSTTAAQGASTDAGAAAGATMQGIAGLATAFSDKKLKTEIKKAPDIDSILSKVKDISYRYKAGVPGTDASKRYVGTTAQDLEKSPMLAGAVETTPQGKKVNGAHVALADLAMIKQLNERLKHVEGSLKGVK